MTISKTDLCCIQPRDLGDEKQIDAWFTLKNLHYTSPASCVNGLNLGFNTPDTTEAVGKNRSRLLSELNIDPEWIAYADQVHGNRIQVVNGGGTYPSTDGLITTIPGLTLAIQVADCAAVLLWDAHNKVIGAFHAGWRGAVAEIIPAGIHRMRRQGAAVEQLQAFVSPCLSLKNFEVGSEVAEQFPAAYVNKDRYVKPHVDLKGFIKSQLRGAGINETNMEVRGEDPVDDARNFYSYRREGEKSGRMMALIRLR